MSMPIPISLPFSLSSSSHVHRGWAGMVTATPLSSRGVTRWAKGIVSNSTHLSISTSVLEQGYLVTMIAPIPISLNVFLSSVRGTIEPWSRNLGIVVAPALSFQLLYSLSLSSKTSLGLFIFQPLSILTAILKSVFGDDDNDLSTPLPSRVMSTEG